MALAKDIHAYRYGSPGNSTQPTNLPLKSATTVYRGSIATTRGGYLVPASSPQSGDLCWGLIDQVGPGYIDGSPGITGGTTDGGVTVEVATGSFWLANGTGADAFLATDSGAVAYVVDEQTVGKTSNGNTRPVAGVLIRTSDAATILSGKVAIRMGDNQSTGGPS